MKIKDPLVRVAVYALSAAFLGLLAGLVFGALIAWLTTTLFILEHTDDFVQLGPFFGMAWGSIIGAILGGVAGLRN